MHETTKNEHLDDGERIIGYRSYVTTYSDWEDIADYDDEVIQMDACHNQFQLIIGRLIWSELN